MANKLKFLKKELALREGGDVIYGISEGYLVTFSQKDKDVEIFVDAKVDPSDANVVERLRTFIQHNATSYTITASSLSNTGISITAADRSAEVVLELFYLLVNQLKVLKIPGVVYCSNCGQQIGEQRKIVKIGRHVHACDEACAQRIMSSDKAKKLTKTTNNRAFLGFLGSLIFTAIGVVPYILLGLKGLPCAYVAFFIPVFCWAGFFLFGGKPCATKLVVCILLPVLFFTVAAFGLLGYSLNEIWLESDYIFTYNEMIDVVVAQLQTDSVLRQEFVMKQLLFGAVFLLIGYVFTLPTAYGKRQPEFAILKDNL